MRSSVSMSVFTASSLFFLLLSTPFSTASALPCPECEEGYPPPPAYHHPQPPPPVIVTEPCDECEHDHHPPSYPHTPPPVIVTETCDECEHHHHPTPKVLTSTISVCRQTKHSITPYTSGKSTFYFSSCHPSTMWYAENATCETATLTTTSISTATLYRNGTAPSAITVTSFATLTGAGPIQYSTKIVTSIESVPAETVITTKPAQQITFTSYAPAQTVTKTRPGQYITLTSYASGKHTASPSLSAIYVPANKCFPS